MMMRHARGFTLVELLLVLVVVGVLAGIAISAYAGFRARGFDSMVASAVRQIATAEEAHFASHSSYTSDVSALAGAVPGDVTLSVEAGNSGDLSSSFRVSGTHPGAEHTWVWLSDPGPGESNLIAS